MKSAKEFYKSYRADNQISPLTFELGRLIMEEKPGEVFEFGCGSGKNLRQFDRMGIVTFGLDISILNVIEAQLTNDLPFVALGDETHLGYLTGFDVSFTCSVLDHIKDIDKIISELKRITRKVIYVAETNDTPGKYYYPHDYESYGFEKLDFEWKSETGDGATYHIWKYTHRDLYV